MLIQYDIALFILMYILPMMILFATYIPITVKLWSDRGLGEITRAQIDSIQSKRRVSQTQCSSQIVYPLLIFAL
ncbi:unnamed protein product [Rodentolepis nana]|uniref:G_PROTEIN_RECEP_F1_2 domain-containing protein n=1 Tax=Rodentolepis nana TaxID=102285 RepID=A0A0R3T0D5_RODNA|nr:unnamed protein product [Rodentolepis nana]